MDKREVPRFDPSVAPPLAMNDINTTPSRNLAKWATSEDLPPQDLFTSIENYRTYVRRWRALYAEITTRMRAERVKGRYTYALWNKARCEKQGIPAGIRPGRKEAAEAAQVHLDKEKSPDWLTLARQNVPSYLLDGDRKELIANHTVVYGSDATRLLQSRQAGKRWVKH